MSQMECRSWQANWTIYTDGGCRYDGRKVYSWVIYADFATPEWQRITVACGAKLVVGDISFTVAEAWGMEAAIGWLRHALC